MGGHGGLNILPQKSWNVYGRKNRLKVAEDEAEQAEKEKGEKLKQQQVEREARLRDLNAAQGSEQDATDGTEQGPVTDADAKHINFWEDLESNATNAAVKEEKKNEQRNRGDVKTRTMDARFDAQFKVAHGLTGPDPWYLKPSTHRSPSPPAASETAAARGAHGSMTKGMRTGKRQRGEKEHKGSKKKKSKHRMEECEARQASPQVVMKYISELRAERLKREAGESGRTKDLLMQRLPRVT